MFVDLSNADRSHSVEHQRAREETVVDASDLFGDPLTRALYREDSYAVPVDQRLTCPVHLDWRSDCGDLHVATLAVA